MKRWFTKEITKEEYDEELRTFLTSGQIRFHNKFILSVLSKCSNSVLSSSPFILSELDLEPDIKRIKLEEIGSTFKSLLQIDPHEYKKEVTSKTLQEELIAKGFLTFLPDHDAIYARMMLHAWEHDLDGVDDNACKLVIEATYAFARNILTAIISRRSGFKTKDSQFMYGLGTPAVSPWLRNAMKYNFNDKCEATEIVNDGEIIHIPKSKPLLSAIEENIAFELALSSENTGTIRKLPIKIDDVIDALRVHSHLVPRYLMYAMHMEKLILTRHHPSWEDIDSAKHLS